MNTSPHWINIAPLLPDHAEEIAADQRWLVANTPIDSVAFVCTLVPEGDPVFDKAAVWAARFRRIKALLAGSGVRCGILLQSTMGHGLPASVVLDGWVPDAKSPFQRHVLENGSEPYRFCPLGKEFLAYIRSQIATLAAEAPDFFMLDDDTRFITGWNGCYCPLHVAEMERLTGRAFTRETLAVAVHGEPETARLYNGLLRDSIIVLARAIREEIDKVDPAIPGSFCCCAKDVRHAADIARALVAPGQELVIRLNNGRYLADSLRGVPGWLHWTAAQIAVLADEAVVLDEPDTCPHNRYSTGATALHMHLSMALLEGCGGGKFWITRMGGYEPSAGLAYRRILAGNAGFYRALVALAPHWGGVRVPLPTEPDYSLPPRSLGLDWGAAALGRFGIPYVNATAEAAVTVLSDDAALQTDDELRAILSRGAILDGRAATILTARGFSDLCGVEASDWSGPVASFEALEDGSRINTKINAVRLRPLSPAAKVKSHLMHRSAALADDAEEVAPGSVFFANKLGGRVFTFAAKLPDRMGLDVFDIYNERRKLQFIETFQLVLGADFAYYPGDAEVLFRDGVTDSGERILAFLNTTLDQMDEIRLHMPDMPQSVERLTPDGTWTPVAFHAEDNGDIVFETEAKTFQVAVLRVANW